MNLMHDQQNPLNTACNTRERTNLFAIWTPRTTVLALTATATQKAADITYGGEEANGVLRTTSIDT